MKASETRAYEYFPSPNAVLRTYNIDSPKCA